MSARRIRPATLVALLAAVPALAGLARAQVPEGSAVVGTYTHPNWPGTPGLFLVPLAGGPVTPVTGLPADLNTNSLGGYQQGTWAVSVRSADGAVIVSTVTSTNAPIAQGNVKLFVLYLNGAAVDPARTQVVTLGTATADAAAHHSLLPDGRILITAGQGGNAPLTSGPMAGTYHAILDLSGPAPVFTLLPNPAGVPGQALGGGLAVDPTGQFAYKLVSSSYHATPANATLLRIDLATGADCPIASFPGETAFGLSCDDDGTVYVSSSTPQPSLQSYVHTVRPNGCNPAAVTTVAVTTSSAASGAWGLDLDRASGRFAATTVRASPQMGDLTLIDPATGVATVVATAPPGGWGLIGNDGVAVNNAIESYGPVSDGQNRYWFDNFPNPGGQPTVGNAGFTLTMASGPGTATGSVLGLSFGRGSLNLSGIQILVDPASTAVRFVPSGLSVPHGLPIPNNASLSGLVLTAQSLHLETAGNLAASRGLTLRVELLPAPTITAVTPPSPVPSATVTVDGSNFHSGIELRVGGNVTPIVSRTTESLTFVMPSGILCDSTVSVTNLGGSSATWAINATPVITSMPSVSGPAAGGALFILGGLNLLDTTVTFNGVPMTNILGQTAVGIVGTTPPGTVGPALIVVSNPNGCQTTANYTYQ